MSATIRNDRIFGAFLFVFSASSIFFLSRERFLSLSLSYMPFQIDDLMQKQTFRGILDFNLLDNKEGL